MLFEETKHDAKPARRTSMGLDMFSVTRTGTDGATTRSAFRTTKIPGLDRTRAPKLDGISHVVLPGISHAGGPLGPPFRSSAGRRGHLSPSWPSSHRRGHLWDLPGISRASQPVVGLQVMAGGWSSPAALASPFRSSQLPGRRRHLAHLPGRHQVVVGTSRASLPNINHASQPVIARSLWVPLACLAVLASAVIVVDLQVISGGSLLVVAGARHLSRPPFPSSQAPGRRGYLSCLPFPVVAGARSSWPPSWPSSQVPGRRGHLSRSLQPPGRRQHVSSLPSGHRERPVAAGICHAFLAGARSSWAPLGPPFPASVATPTEPVIAGVDISLALPSGHHRRPVAAGICHACPSGRHRRQPDRRGRTSRALPAIGRRGHLSGPSGHCRRQVVLQSRGPLSRFPFPVLSTFPGPTLFVPNTRHLPCRQVKLARTRYICLAPIVSNTTMSTSWKTGNTRMLFEKTKHDGAGHLPRQVLGQTATGHRHWLSERPPERQWRATKAALPAF
jgi:hypothetical protein